MALDKATLKGRIITEFVALGAVSTGEHSWVEEFAEAIANAVVDEITTNAAVNLGDGTIS